MRIRVFLLVFISAMSLSIGTYVLLAQQAQNAAVEQVVRQMGDSYNKKDLAFLERISDPNVLIFEQGTKTVGLTAMTELTKTEWDSFADFNWDVGKIQVYSVGKDFAWATSEGSFKAKMKDGTQVQESAMMSCIFQKKNGAWKLVHYHFSSAPMKK